MEGLVMQPMVPCGKAEAKEKGSARET